MAGIIIISMMISVIIFLEYYYECHATFGLLVVSMIIFMMLVDVLLLGVLFSEMMFTCGYWLDSLFLHIGVVVLLLSDSS